MRINTTVIPGEAATTVFLATDAKDPAWAMFRIEPQRMRGFASGGDEGGLHIVRPVTRDLPANRGSGDLETAILDFMRVHGLKMPGKGPKAGTTVSAIVSEWESFLGTTRVKSGPKAMDEHEVVDLESSFGIETVTRMMGHFTEKNGFHVPRAKRSLKIGNPISGMEAIKIQATVAARLAQVPAPLAIDRAAAEKALRAVARPSSRAVLWYGTGTEENRADRAQAAASYPILAGMIADSPTLARAVDSREPLQPLLIEHTGIGKGGLKRLAKMTEAPAAGPAFEDGLVEGEDALGINRQRRFRTSGALSLSRAMRVLADLGPDRIPQDDTSWRIYNDILAGVAIPLENALDLPVRTIMEASKGDWIEFHKILAKAADLEPAEFDRRAMLRATVDALESMEDLSRSAILPLMLSTIEAEGQEIPPVSPEYFEEGMAIASRVIIGQSKNIAAAILEASRRYASRIPTLVNAAGFIEDNSVGVEAYGPEEFPVLCEDYVSANGVHIRPFRNFEEMREESRRLRHCVGSVYLPSARNASNHIFSLQNAEGTVSYSTLRFIGITGENAAEAAANLRVGEHRQINNRDPRPECLAAAEEFIARIKHGEIRLNFDEIVRWRDTVRGVTNNPQRPATVSWSSALGMKWDDEKKRSDTWEEWRYIIGGRFAKAEHPGILWTDKGARALLGEMNPVAAASMERRAREQREAAKAAAEPAPEPGM